MAKPVAFGRMMGCPAGSLKSGASAPGLNLEFSSTIRSSELRTAFGKDDLVGFPLPLRAPQGAQRHGGSQGRDEATPFRHRRNGSSNAAMGNKLANDSVRQDQHVIQAETDQVGRL
ncbi:MAG TPA: hypothetical protein VFK46_05570 [Candidatus Macondimonas sp.]|nr:hypothetical protein [Candidatus Macondimonas sp.]